MLQDFKSQLSVTVTPVAHTFQHKTKLLCDMTVLSCQADR